ncbi:MAG TPA: GNAT family N-acetyltransferase, partial [Candidatus Obscuribacterales bacterium]
FGTPGWQLYLAYCGQTPAAAAVLYIQDDLAYLAAAATVPAQRRKGCQQALLRHRLQEAALAGCRLVTGRCEPYSPSQHNMERAGLRLAAVSAIWTRP